jgi:hypothetical protein
VDKYILQRFNDQYGRWDDYLTFEEKQMDDVLIEAKTWYGYRIIKIIMESK